MTFDDAIQSLSREERFMATVSAMNMLLIHKGVYTSPEFEACFCQWAEAETKKRAGKRAGRTATDYDTEPPAGS